MTAHKPKRVAPPPPTSSYHVTSHARVECECGHFVYTESRDGNPPALPATCWFCGKAVPK